jgi:hypothetical protein
MIRRREIFEDDLRSARAIKIINRHRIVALEYIAALSDTYSTAQPLLYFQKFVHIHYFHGLIRINFVKLNFASSRHLGVYFDIPSLRLPCKTFLLVKSVLS